MNFLFHYITHPVYTLCQSFCRHLSHDFSKTVNQLTRQKLSKLLSFRLMSFSGMNTLWANYIENQTQDLNKHRSTKYLRQQGTILWSTPPTSWKFFPIKLVLWYNVYWIPVFITFTWQTVPKMKNRFQQFQSQLCNFYIKIGKNKFNILQFWISFVSARLHKNMLQPL